MEETIETRVSPERIWQAWEMAHAKQGGGEIRQGQKGQARSGRKKGFKYEVFDVVRGERFTLVWKTRFVRLVFSHSLIPTIKGSIIKYSVQIRGPFAIPIRWLLGNKIQANIRLVLKTMVRHLENEF